MRLTVMMAILMMTRAGGAGGAEGLAAGLPVIVGLSASVSIFVLKQMKCGK